LIWARALPASLAARTAAALASSMRMRWLDASFSRSSLTRLASERSARRSCSAFCSSALRDCDHFSPSASSMSLSFDSMLKMSPTRMRKNSRTTLMTKATRNRLTMPDSTVTKPGPVTRVTPRTTATTTPMARAMASLR